MKFSYEWGWIIFAIVVILAMGIAGCESGHETGQKPAKHPAIERPMGPQVIPLPEENPEPQPAIEPAIEPAMEPARGWDGNCNRTGNPAIDEWKVTSGHCDSLD